MGEKVTGTEFTKPIDTKKSPPQQIQTPDDSNIFENTCDDTKPCVAVIDNFDYKAVDMSVKPNESTSITHGEVVTSFIKSEYPEANFIKYDTSIPKRPLLSIKKMINALKDIKQRIDNGQKISAVNLSAEFLKPMNELKEDNKELKKSFSTEMQEELALIEEIIQKGTPVFIAGGNSKGSYNQLNLAEGAINVGMEENRGCKNDLINKKEQGFFDTRITSSDKKENTTCFDYTEDGKADYCSEYVSSLDLNQQLWGSSLSTPKFLGKYLKEKY